MLLIRSLRALLRQMGLTDGQLEIVRAPWRPLQAPSMGPTTMLKWSGLMSQILPTLSLHHLLELLDGGGKCMDLLDQDVELLVVCCYDE